MSKKVSYQDFLKNHQGYKVALEQFFEWKQADKDQYIKDLRDLSNKEKEDALDQYEQDMKDWWEYIAGDGDKKKGHWPNSKFTRNAKLNPIRQYLIANRIELPAIVWKEFKRGKNKGACAATQDRIPTRHELRKIMLEGKPIARTMFLCASCTGMRLGEIMQIKRENIDLNMDPIWINIPGEITKTGDARTVYLSDETAIYLRKWLSDEKDSEGNYVEGTRAKYLQDIKQRMNQMATHEKYKDFANKHQADDGKIFPISRQTAESYWQLMLKRANLDQRDPTTKVRVLHLHTLRKFFRTNMAKPLGVDITEAILGHRGYLTDAYRRYPKHDLAQLYKEKQEYVTIIQEPKALEKLDAENKVKDDKIRKLEDELEGLKFRMKVIEELGKQNEKIEKITQDRDRSR